MTTAPRNVVHGFELIREEALPEYKSAARLYRHMKTGAELLSLVNSDENKVFSITFRTPPRDSTGIAHILEHSVLCGSRKYPVKAPFVELMKGSLATFLNAMTFPDKTCYPVASTNLQDFYNLVDVYLDSVFYPRITARTLEQEGWHYELESPGAPLTYKGVVYNEMKGNYSSPDYILSEQSQRSLFPDTTYGEDSGGDPRHIPDLTYETFKAFHERCYHPSNALIFFHGDDDPDERLRRLDSWLSAFEPIDEKPIPALQPRFPAPRRVTKTCAGGRSGKPGMVTVNWMLGEIPDADTSLALSILDYALIGTPASPLRKALTDSKLGEDFAGSGLEKGLRQGMFSVGLRGIDPADADKVQSLILDTVGSLAEKGIDPLTIEAAINTAEFRLRENNTGGTPQGMGLMFRALDRWPYGQDAIAPLAFERPLGALRARLAAGERVFEGLLQRHLLSNSHRTTVTLRADPALAHSEEAELRNRLDAIRANMSEAEINGVIETTRTLKQLQETPDSPEALATIPSLELKDLQPRNKIIPIEVTEMEGARVLHHDLGTNGLIYLDSGLNLHALPADLLPYTSLFGRALIETGVRDQDFVAVSQRIGRLTGGIRPQRWTSAIRDSDKGTAWLFLRGKCVAGREGELLSILGDLLLEARLDNHERLRQLVLEEKAMVEARVLPMGTQFANMRLRSGFHEADWATEQMGGISYLLFLRQLAKEIEADATPVQKALERIREMLINRRAMLFNVTAEAAHRGGFERAFSDFLQKLPSSTPATAAWPKASPPAAEGLIIPVLVNYVAKGADLHRLGYRPGGAAAVIRHYLGATWLWEKVRVQGGAYGGFAAYDRLSGAFSFLSYRDPNLLATIDVYDKTARFLKEAEISPTEIKRAIIGTIGELDDHLLPDAKGAVSMHRYLAGDTDDVRQRVREEILGATAADFRNFSAALEAVAERGQVVVIGSEQAIEAANAQRPDWLTTSKLV